MSIYVIIVVIVIVIGIVSDRVPDLFYLTYMISSIVIINIVVIAITDCINVMICIVIISNIKPYDIIPNATKTVPLLYMITHSNVTIYCITLIIMMSVDIMI